MVGSPALSGEQLTRLLRVQEQERQLLHDVLEAQRRERDRWLAALVAHGGAADSPGEAELGVERRTAADGSTGVQDSISDPALLRAALPEPTPKSEQQPTIGKRENGTESHGERGGAGSGSGSGGGVLAQESRDDGGRRTLSEAVAGADCQDQPAHDEQLGHADEQCGDADEPCGTDDEQSGPAEEQRGYADEQYGYADEEQYGFADEQSSYSAEQSGSDDEQSSYADEPRGYADERRGHADERRDAAGGPHGYDEEQRGYADEQRDSADERRGAAPEQRGYAGEQSGRPEQTQLGTGGGRRGLPLTPAPRWADTGGDSDDQRDSGARSSNACVLPEYLRSPLPCKIASIAVRVGEELQPDFADLVTSAGPAQQEWGDLPRISLAWATQNPKGALRRAMTSWLGRPLLKGKDGDLQFSASQRPLSQKWSALLNVAPYGFTSPGVGDTQQDAERDAFHVCLQYFKDWVLWDP